MLRWLIKQPGHEKWKKWMIGCDELTGGVPPCCGEFSNKLGLLKKVLLSTPIFPKEEQHIHPTKEIKETEKSKETKKAKNPKEEKEDREMISAKKLENLRRLRMVVCAMRGDYCGPREQDKKTSCLPVLCAAIASADISRRCTLTPPSFVRKEQKECVSDRNGFHQTQLSGKQFTFVRKSKTKILAPNKDFCALPQIPEVVQIVWPYAHTNNVYFASLSHLDELGSFDVSGHLYVSSKSGLLKNKKYEKDEKDEKNEKDETKETKETKEKEEKKEKKEKKEKMEYGKAVLWRLTNMVITEEWNDEPWDAADRATDLLIRRGATWLEIRWWMTRTVELFVSNLLFAVGGTNNERDPRSILHTPWLDGRRLLISAATSGRVSTLKAVASILAYLRPLWRAAWLAPAFLKKTFCDFRTQILNLLQASLRKMSDRDGLFLVKKFLDTTAKWSENLSPEFLNKIWDGFLINEKTDDSYDGSSSMIIHQKDLFVNQPGQLLMACIFSGSLKALHWCEGRLKKESPWSKGRTLSEKREKKVLVQMILGAHAWPPPGGVCTDHLAVLRWVRERWPNNFVGGSEPVLRFLGEITKKEVLCVPPDTLFLVQTPGEQALLYSLSSPSFPFSFPFLVQ